MATKTWQLYVDGEFVEPGSGERFGSVDPYTGEEFFQTKSVRVEMGETTERPFDLR